MKTAPTTDENHIVDATRPGPLAMLVGLAILAGLGAFIYWS